MRIYEVIDSRDDQDFSGISPEDINNAAQSLAKLTLDYEKSLLEKNQEATRDNVGEWAENLKKTIESYHDVYSIIELCRVLDMQFENSDTSRLGYSSDSSVVTSEDIDDTYEVLNELVMNSDTLDSVSDLPGMTKLVAQIKRFVNATAPMEI